MISSFATTSSAPPTTTSAANTRMVSNNTFNRTTSINSNQQTSARLKSTYDNRRYSNVQSTYKRSTQPSITLNPKNVSPLARIEVTTHPSARLLLQQQISSPGRLQHQQQFMSTPQMVVPAGSILDPLVIGRTRQVPLPPPPPTTTIRNAIHRNAVSLNALSTNQQNGLTSTRGRSQNSAYKTSLSNRTTRLRHQSSAPYDLQQQQTQSSMPYATTTVIYRHPLNTDSPPVFFE